MTSSARTPSRIRQQLAKGVACVASGALVVSLAALSDAVAYADTPEASTSSSTTAAPSTELITSYLMGEAQGGVFSSASYSDSSTTEVTESEVELVEAVLDSNYTQGGKVSEATGDAQQAEAVQEAQTLIAQGEELGADELAHVARIDMPSDVVLVGATWPEGDAEPASVEYRSLINGVWSAWSEMEIELSPFDVSGMTNTRGGTEPVSLSNVTSVEVVARSAEGDYIPGLVINVIDAEANDQVDNALAGLEGEQTEPEEPQAEESNPDQVEELEEAEPAEEDPAEVPEPGSEDDTSAQSGAEEETLEDTLVDLEGSTSTSNAFDLESDSPFENLGPYTPDSSPFVGAGYNSSKTQYSTGYDGLVINTRKGWGADESYMTWKPKSITIKGAVIHHTESSGTYTRDQVAQQIRNIYHYHAVTRGWGDIGYNLIVDRFGGVWEGRSGGLTKGIQGGHAIGANADTFGITMMGSFTSQAPTTTAQDAMAKAIAWKLSVHGKKTSKGKMTVPGSRIQDKGKPISVDIVTAHRDVQNTSCPGDAFYAKMSSMRTKVEKYMSAQSGDSTITPTPTPPKDTSTFLTDWDPGGVISDTSFFNYASMTEAQIKTFIQNTGKSCTSTSSKKCLKDQTFKTVKLKTERGGCKPLNLTGDKRPWTIIYQTALACGLNPQVILVTMQKEQSALTQPLTETSWAKTMGSNCPDGKACDPAQGGFQKQVYYGADKLVSYSLKETSLTWEQYVKDFRAGKTSTLPHTKATKCDVQTITIKNNATAALYMYTPYIGGSTGEGCTAVGARMFWNLMTRYFPEALKSPATKGSTAPVETAAERVKSGSGSSGGSDTTTKPSSGTTTASLMWGKWKTRKNLQMGWPKRVTYPGDFNGNGYPDLIMINSKGHLMLYPGKKGEKFGKPIKIGTGWKSMDMVLGGVDWNGDGKTDLIAKVAATGEMFLYPGTGDGKLGKRKSLGRGWNGFRVISAARTVDGPGLYAISGGTLYLYPGNGKGGLKSRVVVGKGYQSVNELSAVGDWNGDGKPDWVTRTKSGGFYLYYGKTATTYKKKTKIGTAWHTISSFNSANQYKAKSPIWGIRSNGGLRSWTPN